MIARINHLPISRSRERKLRETEYPNNGQTAAVEYGMCTIFSELGPTSECGLEIYRA